MKASWMWLLVIVLSALVAILVSVVFPTLALRPFVVMWFLFVCPGMTLVRFFRFNNAIVEWTLALSLSFSIDSIVASIVLYAGKWSPVGIMELLVAFCLCGVIMQSLLLVSTSRKGVRI